MITWILICLSICNLYASVPYIPKTTSGVPCLVPFTYKGENHHDCVGANSAKPWCYTNANGAWDYCSTPLDSSSCPISSPAVNATEVQMIVEIVNNLRKKVSANRMAKVEWNTELAMLSQSMSDKCSFNTGSDQKLCDKKNYFGQMSFQSSSTKPMNRKWMDFIFKFYNNKDKYDIDTNSCSIDSCYGYKQLVTANLAYIGCGMKSCNDGSFYRDYYFCTFYPPLYNGVKPYEKGNEKCKYCFKLDENYKHRCNDNLCEKCYTDAADCEGKEKLIEAVKNGEICDDLSPTFCYSYKAYCTKLDMIPVSYKTRLTSECKKTCGFCT